MRSSRVRPLLALAFLFALVGSAAAGPVSVQAFLPTQMEIGRHAVRFRVNTWKAEARQQGMTLKQYALRVLRPKFESLELSTVIDPDGNYRNTDAHHRISALREVERLTGVELRITPKVIADYRGKSFDEYAHHFIKELGKGQFTPEVEALSITDRMRHLPRSYAELNDNTMRSALEVVFEGNGISGSWMRDYVEFRAARKLVEEGLLDDLKAAGILPRGARGLPTKLVEDARVQAILRERIASPEGKRWLLGEALNDNTRELLADKLKQLK
jgi:hypothetical protein